MYSFDYSVSLVAACDIRPIIPNNTNNSFSRLLSIFLKHLKVIQLLYIALYYIRLSYAKRMIFSIDSCCQPNYTSLHLLSLDDDLIMGNFNAFHLLRCGRFSDEIALSNYCTLKENTPTRSKNHCES